jgi:gamma-D-glutamyl-L-lysine dipeptidyl-peptidase
MMHGICNLAIIPLRAEANDRSEMVSQVLFGEHFDVLESAQSWTYIRLADDRYTGWIDTKQYRPISNEHYELIQTLPKVLVGDLVEFLTTKTGTLIPVPLGASVGFLKHEVLNTEGFVFDGSVSGAVSDKSGLISTAFLYLNAPYLWGGKTPFGIDCSGFTQMVYKLNGYALPRDASQQALVGEALSFIEESEPGDLAFFDNEEGKIIHVGIIMENNYIIHASGKVRIDRLDHLGIYNAEVNRHTHKLRVIKKYL